MSTVEQKSAYEVPRLPLCSVNVAHMYLSVIIATSIAKHAYHLPDIPL